jgi:L-fuculose-phosphate aldolase
MSLVEKYRSQVDQFVTVCRLLASFQYVSSAGGNLAWKLEDNLMIITPTKTYKGAVGPDEVVFIDMEGKTVEGKLRPTGEVPMYLTFFRCRPDIESVVHCHPTAACALAITKGKNWLMRPFYPELSTEVGPVPLVPYAEPLTEELARNFEPFLPRYNSFIMENHGLVTMTRSDILTTFHTIDLLEASARSILMALSIGEVKELDRKAVENLDNTMRTRSLPLFGLPGSAKSLVDLYFPEGE